MIVSQRILHPACVEVLDRERVPMHYKRLRAAALSWLGVTAASPKELHRMGEDVREQLAVKRKRGTFYVEQPDCLVAKRDWFERDPTLYVDPMRIPGDATAGVAGGVEFMLRMLPCEACAATRRPCRHALKDKWEGKSDEDRATTGVRGYVLEKHVAMYFARRWPDAYSPADNANNRALDCKHDFKLRFAGREWRMDVAGRKRTGDYGLSPGKSPTDFHLLSYIDGQRVVIEALQRGEDFRTGRNPTRDLSPLRLVVRLNCEARGLDYDAIAARAGEVTR